MEYIRPHYYEKFSCIASACEDTCCAGWQIAIDEQSMEVYKNMAGGFGNRLHNCIDWKEAVFERDIESGRCAFLNEEDLCDIYAEAGEEYLCKTCREFPRHTEEYEGIREQSLSLACPVAAALILSDKDKVTFDVSYDDKEDSCDEGFDFLYFTKVMDARECIFSILQNRQITMEKRMQLAHEFGSAFQRLSDEDDLFAIDDLIEDYTSRTETKNNKESNRREQMKQGFLLLDKLELLRPEWKSWKERCCRVLYESGEKDYDKIWKEFRETDFQEQGFDLEILKEQLMVYFIFIYLGAGFYDGEILAKIKMALWGTEVIVEMCMAKWFLQKKELSFHDVTEIARWFSREVEHSDVNLETIDCMMIGE